MVQVQSCRVLAAGAEVQVLQRCRWWWIEMLRCGGEDNVNVKVKIWLRC